MTDLQTNIKATWDLVYTPGAVVEIRGLVNGSMKWEGKYGKTISGYFDNFEAFHKAATQLYTRGKLLKGIYTTLNPVNIDLLARANNRLVVAEEATKDSHILWRRFILIDTDPDRPSGISSNETELQAAIERRDVIKEHLLDLGFPEMVTALSGNGAHLLIRVDDLPNNEESNALVKGFLAGLGERFSDEAVKVDQTVFNAARITKLYGTTAYKGDKTDDRPWRESSLTFVPNDLQPATVDLLRKVATKPARSTVKPTKPSQAGASWTDTVETVEAWLQDHGVSFRSDRISHTDNGFEYKWKVDCLTSTEHTDGAVIMWGAGKGMGYKCHHDSCSGQGWPQVRAILDPKQPGGDSWADGFSSDSGPGLANDDPGAQDAGEDSPDYDRAGVVADMMRSIIDGCASAKNPAISAARLLEDVKPIVSEMGKEERRDPRIIEQLSRLFDKDSEAIERWLKSCGRKGQPEWEKWVAALRGLPYQFALNRLEDEIEVNGARLDDLTRSKIYLAMQPYKGATRGYVEDVINVLASEKSYHPVQRYLLGLEWDGQDHVTKFLQHIHGDGKAITYSDGSRAPLCWVLIRRWLLGCVARGLDGDKPIAFKHQTPMLVFVGKQGLGKSTMVAWLASGIGPEYHQEGAIDPHSTEDKRSMVTKWIWEVGELGGSLRKSDRDSLKAFITQGSHTYRKPWGRSNIVKPTLCNLVGSVNKEAGFLDDPTGHRRFLPVELVSIDRNYSQAVDVNQLWAQLVHEYTSGKATPELSKSEREALAVVHKEHEVENPLETYLQLYFDIAAGDESKKTFTAEIITRLQEFGIKVSANTKVAGRELNDALAPLGLERKYLSINGVKGWGWVGITPNAKPTPSEVQTAAASQGRRF